MKNIYVSTKKGDQPPFFKWFGFQSIFPISTRKGFKISSLQPIAKIPCYTLEKNEYKKEKMKKEYEEQEKQDYENAKKIYEENVFVGAKLRGNNPQSEYKKSEYNYPVQISKIDTENGFIWYCATKEHKENAIREGFKPINSEKYLIEIFISGIESRYFIFEKSEK